MNDPSAPTRVQAIQERLQTLRAKKEKNMANAQNREYKINDEIREEKEKLRETEKRMHLNAGELIAILKKSPPNTPVYTTTRTNWGDDIESIPLKAEHVVHHETYCDSPTLHIGDDVEYTTPKNEGYGTYKEYDPDDDAPPSDPLGCLDPLLN